MQVTYSILLNIFHTCCAVLNLLDPTAFNLEDLRPKKAIITECIAVQSCCYMGKVDDRINVYERTCKRKLNITGGLNKEQKMCVSECVAKNMGFLDKNGVLNAEMLREVLYQNLSNLHKWLDQEFVNPILDMCIQGSIDNMGMQCNGDVDLIQFCVFFEAQSLCPESHAINSKQCLTLLRYMERHASYPPRKHWC